jgi:hypothetical protein
MIQIDKINNRYTTKIKQQKLVGRYINFNHIKPLILNLPSIFKYQILGHSFDKRPIYKIKFGNGSKRILIWSQMHGNESTGTKALFDIFSLFTNPLDLKDFCNTILSECTIICIPMLNPDGAQEYSRFNAQNIDLNRDAVDLKAPESKLLHDLLHDFKPHYCFNLHDQRTIFSVGEANNPATLSFLAPSIDEKRTITTKRQETMSIIVAMNQYLQKIIPNQVGRYTDEFYPTATGDNFQKSGFNTILIEAGHYKNDYQREMTRKFNFLALLRGIYSIGKSDKKINYKQYFQIPNNKQEYLDIIFENIQINNIKHRIGVYFKEKYIESRVKYDITICKTDSLINFNANTIITEKYYFKAKKDAIKFIKKFKI